MRRIFIDGEIFPLRNAYGVSDWIPQASGGVTGLESSSSGMLETLFACDSAPNFVWRASYDRVFRFPKYSATGTQHDFPLVFAGENAVEKFQISRGGDDGVVSIGVKRPSVCRSWRRLQEHDVLLPGLWFNALS